MRFSLVAFEKNHTVVFDFYAPNCVGMSKGREMEGAGGGGGRKRSRKRGGRRGTRGEKEKGKEGGDRIRCFEKIAPAFLALW